MAKAAVSLAAEPNIMSKKFNTLKIRLGFSRYNYRVQARPGPSLNRKYKLYATNNIGDSEKTLLVGGEAADRNAQTPRPIFPFTAIVGQEEMKLSLILNVIDPKIGGVMIMGDRGTGKSTAVRALVDLLPEINVVSDDPFHSDPEDPESMSDFVREKLKKNESLSINQKKFRWSISL